MACPVGLMVSVVQFGVVNGHCSPPSSLDLTELPASSYYLEDEEPSLKHSCLIKLFYCYRGSVLLAPK